MLGKNLFKYIQNNTFVRAAIIFTENHGFEHAGYCAFLNLFSIIPLFIILISALSSLYETQPGIEIIRSTMSLLPDYALSFIGPQLDIIFSKPSMNWISFVFLSTIWTTSSSLEGMRTIFNKIYHVKDPPFFLITRLVSILQFFLLIIFTVIAISALVIFPKIIHIVEKIIHRQLPHLDYPYINTILIFLILTNIIGLVYYSLTNKRLRFVEVLPGALLTVTLWYLSIHILTYYLTNLADFNIVYGSMTGVIITLLFFYMTNIILIYGSAVNYMLRKNYPSPFNATQKRILNVFNPKKKRAKK